MTGWRPEDSSPPPKRRSSRNPSERGPTDRVRGAKRGNTTLGTITNSKIRWLLITGFEVALFEGYDGYEPGDRPDHDEVNAKPMRLSIRKPGQKKALQMHLTMQTEEELVALKEFLIDAIDRAIAIAAKLDAKAQQHKREKGNEATLARLYRRPPQVFDRTGDESPDGEGVQG